MRRMLLGGLFAMIPAFLHASPCSNLTVKINYDIANHYSSVQTQSFPWTNLTWLRNQLGPAILSTTDNKTRYKWQCPNNSDAYLTVFADNTGTVLEVEGQYSTENGSGLFSITLKQNSQIAEAQPSNPPSPKPEFVPTLPEPNNPCRDYIDQICADIKNYSFTLHAQHLPWMQYATLEQKLGKPEITSAEESLYRWDDYTFYESADGSKASLGQLPEDSHAHSLEEIINLLGEPNRTQHEKLTVYKWLCPAGNNSFLTILTENESMITVLGQSCTTKDCTSFMKNLELSKLAKELHEQPISSSEPIENAKLDPNALFHLMKYYTNLRACTPGNYQYVLPMVLGLASPVSLIEGQKENHCVVETSYDVPNIGKVEMKCRYEVKDLQIFTEKQAELLAKGEPSDDLQRVQQTQCQRFLNGELQDKSRS